MTDLHNELPLNSLFQPLTRFAADKTAVGEKMISKIIEARTSLLLDLPFFGYVLSHFQIVPVITTKIHNFSVDGHFLYFNTKFLVNLCEQSSWKNILKTHLIHLLLHIIYLHQFREKDKIPRIWGIAADIVVFQSMMGMDQKWTAPPDWNIPSQKHLPESLLGLSTETVYSILLDASEDHSMQQSQNSLLSSEQSKLGEMTEDQLNYLSDFLKKINDSVSSSVSDHENMNQFDKWNYFSKFICDLDQTIDSVDAEQKNDQNLREELIKGIIRTAYSQTKDHGTLPNNLQVIIDNLLTSKYDWRLILTNYIQKVLPSDITWSHPNKRLLSHGYYLPSLLKENLQVVVGVDTSGSIDPSILQTYLSEIQNVLDSTFNTTMIIVDCDTKIQQIKYYASGEFVGNHVFKGQGGTDFRPIFSELLQLNADLLIYFTDGYGTFPKNNLSDIPVIWLLNSDVQPPFGHVIRIDLETS